MFASTSSNGNTLVPFLTDSPFTQLNGNCQGVLNAMIN